MSKESQVAIFGLALFAPALDGKPANVTSAPVALGAKLLHSHRGDEERIHERGWARMKMRCCSTKPLEVFIFGGM